MPNLLSINNCQDTHQRRGIVEVRDRLYLGLAELVLEGRVMMVMVVMMIVIVLS